MFEGCQGALIRCPWCRETRVSRKNMLYFFQWQLAGCAIFTLWLFLPYYLMFDIYLASLPCVFILYLVHTFDLVSLSCVSVLCLYLVSLPCLFSLCLSLVSLSFVFNLCLFLPYYLPFDIYLELLLYFIANIYIYILFIIYRIWWIYFIIHRTAFMCRRWRKT